MVPYKKNHGGILFLETACGRKCFLHIEMFSDAKKIIVKNLFFFTTQEFVFLSARISILQ